MTKILRNLALIVSFFYVIPMQGMLSLWWTGPTLAYVTAKGIRYWYDKSQQMNRIEERIDETKKIVQNVESKVDQVKLNVDEVKQQIENRCKELGQQITNGDNKIEQTIEEAKKEITAMIGWQDEKTKGELKAFFTQKIEALNQQLKEIKQKAQQVVCSVFGMEQQVAQLSSNQVSNAEKLNNQLITVLKKQDEQNEESKKLQAQIDELKNQDSGLVTKVNDITAILTQLAQLAKTTQQGVEKTSVFAASNFVFNYASQPMFRNQVLAAFALQLQNPSDCLYESSNQNSYISLGKNLSSALPETKDLSPSPAVRKKE